MIFEAHPTELVFGTRVPYAIFHQTGTSRGLPRRRPIELTEQTRRECVKILQRWLVEGALA
jgi:phage gpG-like protein